MSSYGLCRAWSISGGSRRPMRRIAAAGGGAAVAALSGAVSRLQCPPLSSDGAARARRHRVVQLSEADAAGRRAGQETPGAGPPSPAPRAARLLWRVAASRWQSARLAGAARQTERAVLIAVLDDATKRVLYAQLWAGETTHGDHDGAARRDPDARACRWPLYTDRAHWAFHTPQANGPVDRRQLTQVGRALARLGIEHIPAYSPQARGRSERLESDLPGSAGQRAPRRARSRRSDGGQCAICASASSPHYNATFSCAPARPGERLRPAGHGRPRADPVSPGGAARRAGQHRRLRGPHLPAGARNPAAARAPASRSRSDDISRASTPSGRARDDSATIRPCTSARAIGERPCSLWKLPQPWTPRTRPPLLGKRTKRVFHSSHRPHSENEKRSDHLSNGSGQITCQQQVAGRVVYADRRCAAASRGTSARARAALAAGRAGWALTGTSTASSCTAHPFDRLPQWMHAKEDGA